MAKKSFLAFLAFAVLLSASAAWLKAQQDRPDIRVAVSLVQLNVAVTDSHGKYVTGLKPSDFEITEDRISQKIATFGEGNEAPETVLETANRAAPAAPSSGAARPTNARGPAIVINGPATPGPVSEADRSSDTIGAAVVGANVFILFDTSNYMYRGFAIAQDAIADFVRSMDGPDRVAFYAYSRDLFRAALLTDDRAQVLHGVRASTAGDNAALYNALLLTLKDAGRYEGRKVIVVFSNGPDNDSMVPPEDVGELAQSEGVPIYMISTRAAQLEPISTAVFSRMASATGGEAFFAKSWRDEQQAFGAIREDLAHLYLINYYPQANPNRGWRAISVKLVGGNLKKYHIRTRSGYRPLPARVMDDETSVPPSS